MHSKTRDVLATEKVLISKPSIIGGASVFRMVSNVAKHIAGFSAVLFVISQLAPQLGLDLINLPSFEYFAGIIAASALLNVISIAFRIRKFPKALSYICTLEGSTGLINNITSMPEAGLNNFERRRLLRLRKDFPNKIHESDLGFIKSILIKAKIGVTKDVRSRNSVLLDSYRKLRHDQNAPIKLVGA